MEFIEKFDTCRTKIIISQRYIKQRNIEALHLTRCRIHEGMEIVCGRPI